MSLPHISLEISDEVLDALTRGTFNEENQFALAELLRAEKTRIAGLPVGFVSPSPNTLAPGSASENMDLDPQEDQNKSGPSASSSSRSLLQVLPCTRNMKSRAKNLIEKLARLRARLVKLGNCDTLEKQKQYFQFRLVGIEDISIDNKKKLDASVGRATLETLVADVTDLIAAVEHEKKSLGAKLQTELNTLANASADKLEVNSEEWLSVKDLWAKTITYNVRWFAEQLVKFEAGLTTKPSKKVTPKEKEPKTRVSLNTNKRPAPAAAVKKGASKKQKKGKGKKEPLVKYVVLGQKNKPKNPPARGRGRKKEKGKPRSKTPPPSTSKKVTKNRPPSPSAKKRGKQPVRK